MLEESKPETTPFEGREFPCPVCGMGLQIRISRREKPYCICNLCGIQIFFRGKAGIRRPKELLEEEKMISARDSSASESVSLYNRLEQLKTQRKELENKQGFIFRNPDLDNAISAVEKEIDRIKNELEKIAK